MGRGLRGRCSDGVVCCPPSAAPAGARWVRCPHPAQAKYEEQEYEAELSERRAEILRSNQEEVARVKEETADAVIDASKQFALDRRRSIGARRRGGGGCARGGCARGGCARGGCARGARSAVSRRMAVRARACAKTKRVCATCAGRRPPPLAATGTKQDIDGWKSERGKNTAEHLKQARANREDAKASRAKAKQLREQIIRDRHREAGQARDLRNRNKLAKDQQLLESGAGVKAVHDGIYRAKYVPSDSADLLNTSKYGKSTSA